jgi:hypothetical protein
VRVHGVEPGALANSVDPPVGGSPVEAVAVTAPQDWALVAFTDGQVDRSRGAWHERDGGGLVALAHDPQRARAALEAKVRDVSGTGLAYTQPVQSEQHGECGVVPIVLLGGEEEHAEFGAVQAASVGGVDLGSADVLGGVRADAPVDVREPVETTDRRSARSRGAV